MYEKTWLRLHRKRLLRRETNFYDSVQPLEHKPFCIVSCQRNGNEAAITCLDSVYNQAYPAQLIQHIFIDDASTDQTPALIAHWLEEHEDHRVTFIRNQERQWALANNLTGFRMAVPGAILIELNGDDWFPDGEVLAFLDKVYEDPDVWMTYNTCMLRDGPLFQPLPLPRKVIATNRYREVGPSAMCRPLHSFRQELMNHIDDDHFLDPDTGRHFIRSADKVFYCALQELCGIHMKHLHRVTYVYNRREHDGYGSAEDKKIRGRKIRAMKRYRPLAQL